jgi:hypothetical protein
MRRGKTGTLGVTLSLQEDPPMQNRSMIAAGGVSFVTAAVTFVSVFTYLALNFDYPAILDGGASEVLPRLLAGGTLMRGTWAEYPLGAGGGIQPIGPRSAQQPCRCVHRAKPVPGQLHRRVSRGTVPCDLFPLVRPFALGGKAVWAMAWLVRSGVRVSLPCRRVSVVALDAARRAKERL